MQIKVLTRHFTLTKALQNYTERRLRFALSSFDDHIRNIIVRLSDINGSRGGAGKRCHIQVVSDGMPDLIIEDTQADLYIAIKNATDCTRRTFQRRIERKQRSFRQAASFNFGFS